MNVRDQLVLAWLRLPHHPFKHGIIRRLYHSAPAPLPVRNAILFANPADYIGHNLLVNGVYEPKTLSCALKFLRPDDLFLDVGANIGLFTVTAARECGCKVVAVEPNHRAFEILRGNIAANSLQDLVTPLCIAIDEKASLASINLNSPQNLGGASMLGVGKLECYSATLDGDSILEALNIDAVALVKIDVEGLEERVIRSLPLDRIQNLIVEWHGNTPATQVDDLRGSALYQYVTERGFEAFDVEDQRVETLRTLVESNVLFKSTR